MSVTQTVEFVASSGLTGLTAKLYQNSDSVAATSSAVSESTNRKGVYQATFTDVAAGNYQLDCTDATGDAVAWDILNGLTLTTATFQCLSMQTNFASSGDSYSTLTAAMTESYAAAGAAPTLAQVQFLLLQMLAGNFSISGTTLTVYKLDGVTVAATFTLNDAVTPTSLARAT